MLDFQPFLLAQQNKKENRNHRRKIIYMKKKNQDIWKEEINTL